VPTHTDVRVERLWTTYPSRRTYAHLGPTLGWLRVRGGRDDTDALLTALQAAHAARSAVTVLTDAAESVVEQVYL
jgi:hypothetical protein